jgi:hypothetical protein
MLREGDWNGCCSSLGNIRACTVVTIVLTAAAVAAVKDLIFHEVAELGS